MRETHIPGMKTLATTTFLLLLWSAVADDSARLAKSLETWTHVKAECGGNYSYTKSWSSFTGLGNQTEIIVRNNFVSERKFREFGGQPGTEPKTWTETGTQLGDRRGAAPPLSLDQLYIDAAAVLARELKPEERRYLKFDKRGLLLSCFTIDTRIADDAPINGVSINKITLNIPKPKKEERAEPSKPKVYTSPGGKKYPTHWGAPPRIQTRDLRRLPGGYGSGSSTLANWIRDKMKKDAR
ncbi:MAG: hypothetical protein ACI8W8_000790 [Rhodothermales bacterium]|jgi:hypothetical protein